VEGLYPLSSGESPKPRAGPWDRHTVGVPFLGPRARDWPGALDPGGQAYRWSRRPPSPSRHRNHGDAEQSRASLEPLASAQIRGWMAL